MKLALLLWLAASLTGATLAAPRCNHFQLGLLFVLLAAAPIAVYVWRRGLTSKRKLRTKQRQSAAADDPADIFEGLF